MFRFAFMLALLRLAQTQSQCGSGNCIKLDNCEPLMSILRQPTRTSGDIQRLKNAFCGYEGTSTKVCCPDSLPSDCVTADGQAGNCVGIKSCPQLLSLIRPSMPDSDRSLISRSRCDGSGQYSVCCSSTVLPKDSPTCTLTDTPPDRDSNCCGVETVSTNKIVGGNATAIDAYPWLALIEYARDTSTRCGGALISGRYVLTAAHCLANRESATHVVLGEYDINNPGQDCVQADGGGVDCTQGSIRIPIDRTIVHPGYNTVKSVRAANDIALIRLSRLAPYTDFIRPICLPTSDIMLSPPSEKLMVAGWGATTTNGAGSNLKRHVDTPLKTQQECRQLYNKGGQGVWDKQMCAGGEDMKDTCHGDSGGPLMYNSGSVTEAVGIVSYGKQQCGLAKWPNIYTKVFDYLPWIRRQIGS